MQKWGIKWLKIQRNSVINLWKTRELNLRNLFTTVFFYSISYLFFGLEFNPPSVGIYKTLFHFPKRMHVDVVAGPSAEVLLKYERSDGGKYGIRRKTEILADTHLTTRIWGHQWRQGLGAEVADYVTSPASQPPPPRHRSAVLVGKAGYR